MNMPKPIYGNYLKAILAASVMVVATGCDEVFDVEYDYNVPDDVSDCPAGMNYRSSGAGIVDRSSGAGIVDRNSEAVNAYCYVDNCSGNWDDSVAATIEWHQDDHDAVVAERRCLASETDLDTDPQDEPPGE